MTVHTDAAVGHEIVITDMRPRSLSITAVDTSSSWLKAHPLEAGRDASGHSMRKVRVEIAAEFVRKAGTMSWWTFSRMTPIIAICAFP